MKTFYLFYMTCYCFMSFLLFFNVFHYFLRYFVVSYKNISLINSIFLFFNVTFYCFISFLLFSNVFYYLLRCFVVSSRVFYYFSLVFYCFFRCPFHFCFTSLKYLTVLRLFFKVIYWWIIII